jgi:hypothetical protein
MSFSLPRLGLLLATLAGVAVFLGATASASSARSCAHPKIRVSKRVVRVGHPIRVTGRTCRGVRGVVHIRLKAGRHWRTVGRTHPRFNGRFSTRVKIRHAKGHRRGRLRAIFSSQSSPSVPLTILPGGGGNCAINQPASTVGMTLPGCRVVASDTASNPNPDPFWGFTACQHDSQAGDLTSGGDNHPMSDGQTQSNSSYRQMTVFDGDNPFGWGARCELGENDHDGPVAFYHQNQRRVTYISMRLPDNFPLSEDYGFQTVLQMKEAQPYDNNLYCCPILFMEAFDNHWIIDSNNGTYWKFPAQRDVWTRFAWDVTYSTDPSRGSIQVSADLNNDGDFDDPGERMPRIHTNTLITETDGPHGTSDGLAPGDAIPSHLRTGIYHDSDIPCPAPAGCSTQVDNIQVVAPTS